MGARLVKLGVEMIPDFFERFYVLKKGDSDIDGLNPEDIPHFPLVWVIGIAIVILLFWFSGLFLFVSW